MTIYNKPSDLPAWAESGDKVQPTNAEIQAGWPLSTVPPSRQRFNWVLNWLATGVRYFMQRGIPEWDATEEYPAGARVQYNNTTYISLTGTANTNQQPDTATTFWERWGFSLSELLGFIDAYLDKSVAGGVNVTLTATEARSGIIRFTGVLTANINVIVPASARRWIIVNGTTGAFTLTVKTPSGTGVAVLQGSNTQLYCDATNVDFGVKSGETPAQFNASKNLATMEALQRALGNLQTVTMYNASQALTASQVGSEIMAYGTAAMTLTLPALSTVPVGAVFKFWSNNTNATSPIVACAGADVLRTGAGTQANISLGAGDSLVIEKTSSSEWLVSGGTKSLKFSDTFAASLATSGYQKLPSGLIIQWGAQGVTGSGTITYPIAFPTAAKTVNIQANDPSSRVAVVNNVPNQTNFGASIYVSNTGALETVAKNVFWVAIGY